MIKKNYYSIKKIEKEISFAFFSRNGGVSKGLYKSLNCSRSNHDKKANVKKNINICLENLKIKKKLILINQIHSNSVLILNNKISKKNLLGDGLITNNKNLALGVLTADCAPIFIYDINRNYICCLHSGWKGALKNISEKAIKILINKKVNKKNINVIVGPCISYKNYEVEKYFKDSFLKKDNSYKNFFKYKNKGKDYFDLRGLINHQFKKIGVKNIYNIKKDTYSNQGQFFSHRRAMHQKKTETGRMLNIIAFK